MGNAVGATPILPALLTHVPEEEEIASVTVDGAYDTRHCHVSSLLEPLPK
jgi:hypothetical protein